MLCKKFQDAPIGICSADLEDILLQQAKAQEPEFVEVLLDS